MHLMVPDHQMRRRLASGGALRVEPSAEKSWRRMRVATRGAGRNAAAGHEGMAVGC
jgi:hypothetical protein